jgi:hypothetical protein
VEKQIIEGQMRDGHMVKEYQVGHIWWVAYDVGAQGGEA